MEAWRLLGEGPGARAACCEVQAGGVTIAQLVEAMEDVWWVGWGWVKRAETLQDRRGWRAVEDVWCAGRVALEGV